MPSQARSRRAEPAVARDRILGAALEEFADRGYEGTSTAEIARRVGVTQPLVHYHFRSKDALWRAVVEHVFGRLDAAFAGLGTELRDVDALTRTKVLLRRFVRFSAEHPALGKFMAREGARRTPRTAWLLERFVRRFHTRIEEALGEGWSKQIAPEHATFVLIAAAAYPFNVPAMVQQLYKTNPLDPAWVERHANAVVEIVFHGLARGTP
jgi:AcrR family transcriptional regulator